MPESQPVNREFCGWMYGSFCYSNTNLFLEKIITMNRYVVNKRKLWRCFRLGVENIAFFYYLIKLKEWNQAVGTSKSTWLKAIDWLLFYIIQNSTAKHYIYAMAPRHNSPVSYWITTAIILASCLTICMVGYLILSWMNQQATKN